MNDSELKDMIIAIDFDGVVCRHSPFPIMGEPVPGAIKWLLRFQELGAKQFLWTCRNDEVLDKAVEYLNNQGVKLEGYNAYDYGADEFSPYPKLFANIYIDDAAIGAPLIYPENGRAYLNWDIVGPIVEERIIKNQRYI